MNSLRWEFRLDEGLAGRVDVVRGDVSRAVFVRRALEVAVGVLEGPLGERPGDLGGVPSRALLSGSEAMGVEASREWGRWPGVVHPKAGVVPRPKGGK